MIYLLLSVFSASMIMVIFKIAGRRNLDNFSLILINYITAAILGFSIGGFPDDNFSEASWLPLAVIIGILFISLFFVVASSTQQIGIAPTSVASKMSVAIPITFSIVYFNESLTLLKVAGIILALISVFLTIYRKSEDKKPGKRLHLMPVVLFFGAGIIDSLIKLSQGTVISREDPLIFSSVLFSISAICGLLYTIFYPSSWKKILDREIFLFGILLGIINFGSLYGIIKALESNIFDSSVIFGINNVGVVLLSVLIAFVIFREKLSPINKAGIILSLVTIAILAWI